MRKQIRFLIIRNVLYSPCAQISLVHGMSLPSNICITPLSIRYVSNCRLAPELHANIEASLVSKRLAISLHPPQRNLFQVWKPIFGSGVCVAIIYDSYGFTHTILTQVSDNEMYSLEDLCNTRSGTLGPALRFQIGNIFLCHLFVYTLRVEYFLASTLLLFFRLIISQGLAHVKNCELCQVPFLM